MCFMVLISSRENTNLFKGRFSTSTSLRAELDSMVRDGIISVVDYPNDWINELQIVEKPNGRLRICLDPRPLN